MSRCVNCALLLSHRLPNRQIREATDAMVNLLNIWISTTTVSGDDFICQECYTILERESANYLRKIVPTRTLGHKRVCLSCGKSILRLPTHKVGLNNPERNFILTHIPSHQVQEVPDVPDVQDSPSENKIKVFCPKCKTEVAHTAEGIQKDQTKAVIAKVYHYLEQEYEELKKMYGNIDLTPLSKFRQRTALATGVSETTVIQILKEEEERNAAKQEEPPRKRRRARKRSRETDSSNEEDTSSECSDGDDDDGEQSTSYVHETQNEDETETLVVKLEPPGNFHEEPEIAVEPVALNVGYEFANLREGTETFIKPVQFELKPRGDGVNKEPAESATDPIAVKIEPCEDEANISSQLFVDESLVKSEEIEIDEEGFS